MGVPLADVRKRNYDRLVSALASYDQDLVGTLNRFPYDDAETWLETFPDSVRDFHTVLIPVYDACLLYLRRAIGEFGLPYPMLIEDGIAPECEEPEDPPDTIDDAAVPIKPFFVRIPESLASCCVSAMQFVMFTVMRAHDLGFQLEKVHTRAYIAYSFLHSTSIEATVQATRLMTELITSDTYIPPYSVLTLLMESSFLIPCGNGSTPESAKETLVQYITNDEIARRVYMKFDGGENGSGEDDDIEVGELLSGPNSLAKTLKFRLFQALDSIQARVALVELQAWSLCGLFTLTLSTGFEDLTSERAPNALKAIAEIMRQRDDPTILPLKRSVTETLWFALSLQQDDGWPEVYALRLGMSPQLLDQNHDCIERLLACVSMGVPNMGSFLPSVLSHIKDDNESPAVKEVAVRVMCQLVRHEDVPPGAFRSQNAYTLLLNGFAKHAAAIGSADNDHDAQMEASLVAGYTHMFQIWLTHARTAELEHALINSDFFDTCADLALPELFPNLPPSTAAKALDIAASILNQSRIEPLVEHGTFAKFKRSLFAIVDLDFKHLSSVARMAAKLFENADQDFSALLKYTCAKLIESPRYWWNTSVCSAFIQLLKQAEPQGYRETLQTLLTRVFKWIFADKRELPSKLLEAMDDERITMERFMIAATSFVFDLLKDAPDLDSPTIRNLFDAAKLANLRKAVPLQYYAAQDLDKCVTKFLLDKAEAQDKTSFILAVDKVALVKTDWAPGLRRPSGAPESYDGIKTMILDVLSEASMRIHSTERPSELAQALGYTLNATKFFSDENRVQFITSILLACEVSYYNETTFSSVFPVLQFLRDATAEWGQIQTGAAQAYNEMLIVSCRILSKALELSDEPTYTMMFTVLHRLVFSTRRTYIPLSDLANEAIRMVLSAAVEFEPLRHEFVIPFWFGKRDERGVFKNLWRQKFAQVATLNPQAILDLARNISDRDFARYLDAFLAAADAAMEKAIPEFAEVVASIVSRMQFPWISYDSINWDGVSRAITMILEQMESNFEKDYTIFGPLSLLFEHKMSLAFEGAYERDLFHRDVITCASEGPIELIGSDLDRLIKLMMKSVQQFLSKAFDGNSQLEGRISRTFDGIGWLLVRCVDKWPNASTHIIDSGLYELLLKCTTGEFRAATDKDHAGGVLTEDQLPRRAEIRTAEPSVAEAVEGCFRAISHAISTAGNAGARKLKMLLETPRVVGFDQLYKNSDLRFLILRRPELLDVSLEYIVGTKKGLVPSSDVPGLPTPNPQLEGWTQSNVKTMVRLLTPAFLGDDKRKAEVAGDTLVDLVASLGTARNVLLDQFPMIVPDVVRRFGPLHSPTDARFNGEFHDTHILETAMRLIAALTIQGLDEPYDEQVFYELLLSSEKVMQGLVDVLKTSDGSPLSLDQWAATLHFISSVLVKICAGQNRLELLEWASIGVPSVIQALRTSQIVSVYFKILSRLAPSSTYSRILHLQVFIMLEECMVLDGYDWPQKAKSAITEDDDSDFDEVLPEDSQPSHRPKPSFAERDVFKNSVLGDIDEEDTDGQYMEVDEEYDSEEDEESALQSEDYDSGSSQSGASESMSLGDSDEEIGENDLQLDDRSNVSRFSESSSDEIPFGDASDENSDEPSAEVIETIFSSGDNDAELDYEENSADSRSDSELDGFDPEHPDADVPLSSELDIVFEGSPEDGLELMNVVLLQFNNDLEVLEEPEYDDPAEEQSYATSALTSEGFPLSENASPVLHEGDHLLAWWSEGALVSSQVSMHFEALFQRECRLIPDGPAQDAAVSAVQAREQNFEPQARPFGSTRHMDTGLIAAYLVRVLYTTLLEKERLDLLQVFLQFFSFRMGRDAIVETCMRLLFDAANGNIVPVYEELSSKLGVDAKLPSEATPALVCANVVRLFYDSYDSSNIPPPESADHEHTCRRVSRAIIRTYGPRLVYLLAMPQISQNRKLLHNASSLVLQILSSTMGTRRFDPDAELLARLTQVMGLRECTSEAFSTLTEIVGKHLRTEALLPHIVREARRARSSLLVLLPAVSQVDASTNVVDSFATEQVKLLRLMSLLNGIYEPQQVLAALKSVNLLPLWHSIGMRLSDGTLTDQANRRGFASGISLLESFALAMVTAKRWKPSVPDTHPSLTQYASWIKSYLTSFMGQRKVLLNELLRARPNLYLGPMGEMARTLNLLDFQSKSKWLREKLNEDAERVLLEVDKDLVVTVSRQNILGDSFASFQGLDSTMLRAPMSVVFENEEAVDAGGVSREWYELISREALNPSYVLFTPTYEGSSVYQVNRDSEINPDHLEYFRFIGQVLGRAIYDNRMVGLYFSRTIYKYLLGRRDVSLSDMEAIDEQYYNSLVWMLEKNVTDVIDETFSVETVQFGQSRTLDLLPDGRNITVTEENKQEYVKLIVEYKLVKSVEKQLEALRAGFNDIIHPSLVEMFDEQELELLLCGLPAVNVDDWRVNTTYVGYTSDSPEVRWFWTAVASFSTEEKAKLLQFSTGTSRVPVHGFAHLQSSSAGTQFQIHKEHGSTDRWPSSHTCMNQVNLPAYESYKKLRMMLLRAITEGSEGFGFV